MIQLHYDRTADALAIDLDPNAQSARTVPAPGNVRLDYDTTGRLIGVEILDASFHIRREDLDSLPTSKRELTLTEAELEHGLKATTLRVLLNNGRLTGRKQGRDWFVDETALVNYLESRDTRGRPATNEKARRPGTKRATKRTAKRARS